MNNLQVFPPNQALAETANMDSARYQQLYQESILNPEAFWGENGKRLKWTKPYTKVKSTSYDLESLSIEWFYDGQLNACDNCLDRHLDEYADKVAIIWEGDDANQQQRITYKQLHQQVSQFANTLKSQGVNKGDVVTIYMPMIPEAVVAMLACARIGAPHSVIFAGFSPDAIAARVTDGNSKLIITADESVRAGQHIPLKDNVDEAISLLDNSEQVKTVIVYQRTGANVEWNTDRDVWWHNAISNQSSDCPVEIMDAEAPLFLLYTSGSTGQPKGVLHTTGGYLVYASMTHEYVFNYQPDDIYWCAADVGWITGHTYMVYGPLANAATIILHEGVPNYPSPARLGEIIDRHQVNILYTSPTLIRALMAKGEHHFDAYNGSSLKVIGSVGEPINPEAWRWYHSNIGKEGCPVVDTWWQTETGGAMITPLPYATTTIPGSATLPFFGIKPELVDNEGNLLVGKAEGNLVISDSWPGQMRTVYGDHKRFGQTYFSTFKGKFFTGDGARRDDDGYYWITGRVDDVLNVSGHRLGTAEIESALVAHPNVAESAIVGYPHDIKGQGIYAYVTLTHSSEPTEDLMRELKKYVSKHLSPIAVPDIIQWAPNLPKTRSGKIMRRFLRKIAANELESLGDTTTLADTSVIEELIKNKHRL
ncbi:acetate--CoA ligase [Shewanella sp. 202IG2-18]|uniref:acetate--CoA ligase n=1 Tax=Parashewanella hymeniacidonis TaxID=2807618 RepID=UPI00195F5AEF|nr:acetate--CoA ligase [Parashewanella hymeniacidonis]MBM7070715.1 acetate--CoA ligase [Parashewanella hymeniacidonis]